MKNLLKEALKTLIAISIFYFAAITFIQAVEAQDQAVIKNCGHLQGAEFGECQLKYIR